MMAHVTSGSVRVLEYYLIEHFLGHAVWKYYCSGGLLHQAH